MKIVFRILLLTSALLASACAAPGDPKDYTAFRAADPRSILVVPAINHSVEVEAADLFLATLAVPLSEKGFYVFPVNMVNSLLKDDGLDDPFLVHTSSTQELASLFNADSVLYVEITEWRSQYALTSNNIIVGFLYTLKDGRTGELLWQDQRRHTHSFSSGSGNIFADLVVAAVVSGVNNARSDYTPVANSANSIAIYLDGQGMPAGPYSPAYKTDTEAFPETGSGNLTNAEISAIAFPIEGIAQATKQEEEEAEDAETQSE